MTRSKKGDLLRSSTTFSFGDASMRRTCDGWWGRLRCAQAGRTCVIEPTPPQLGVSYCMLVSLPTTRADKKRETSWPHLVMLTVSASQRLPAMGYLKSSFRCAAILHPTHHYHYECSLNLTRGCLQVVEYCGWTTRRRESRTSTWEQQRKRSAGSGVVAGKGQAQAISSGHVARVQDASTRAHFRNRRVH